MSYEKGEIIGRLVSRPREKRKKGDGKEEVELLHPFRPLAVAPDQG